MLDPKLLASYNATRTTRHTGVFCHAPFVSMNFAQNGDVTACCYNRKYVLGAYPAATLDEIWHGEAAQRLRVAMRRNDLPQGCNLCLSQFWSGNFSGLRARSFDHLVDTVSVDDAGPGLQYPRLMEFEISNVCNLECTMCNGFFSSLIRRNREKLPALENPYDDDFVTQLEGFIPHLTEARFLGGEPFLISTYYKIWERIGALNPRVRVAITTNGTIVNDRVKSVLDKLNASIIMSIDSLSRDTYESIRLNADYDTVMRNIEFFRDYTAQHGNELSFAVCPMRQNWQELPDIVRYCNARNIGVFFNTVVYPNAASFHCMAHAELAHVVETLDAARFTAVSDLQSANEDHYRDLIRQLNGYLAPKANSCALERHDIIGSQRALAVFPRGAASVEHDHAEHTVSVKANSSEEFRVVSGAVSFERGRRYVVQFRARGLRPCEVTITAGRPNPWQPAGVNMRFGLVESWQAFEFEFTATADADAGHFVIVSDKNTVGFELSEFTFRTIPREPADGEETTAPTNAAAPVFVTFFQKLSRSAMRLR